MRKAGGLADGAMERIWHMYSENICLGAFSLVTLALVYFNVRQPVYRTLPQNGLFAHIVLACLIIVLLDIISMISNAQPGGFFRTVNIASNVLAQGGSMVPALLWVCYVDLQLFRDTRQVKRLRVPLVVLLVFNVAFHVAGLFTGWVFSVDADNVLIRGPLYAPNLALLSVPIVCGAIMTVRNRRRVRKRMFRALIFFPVPLLAGGILHAVFQGYALVWGGLAISVLVVYTSIQNKSMNTDYLTGIYNRRELDRYIREKIEATITGQPFSAILVDLDGFKRINDTWGHARGDTVLQTTARLIRECLRSEDFIARYGGDEFCVVLDVGDREQLEEVAGRIRQRIERFNQSCREPYRIELSMGYDVYREIPDRNPEQFLARIDALMYMDKKKRSV